MPDVFFQGPSGRLEGKFYAAPSPQAPIALILHPNPHHGGTMNNKVVYTMYKTFAHAGFSVLRFNFRGVGRSEGVSDQGDGELSDAAAAMDWMHTTFPMASCFWIAGFSFGAWIALQLLMRRPEIRGFVAVSPPADRYDFSFLSPCPVSGQVIQGDVDEIVTYASVDRLMKRVVAKPGVTLDFQTIEGAGHFFSKHQDVLSHVMDDYIRHKLTIPSMSVSPMRSQSISSISSDMTAKEQKERLLMSPFQAIAAAAR